MGKTKTHELSIVHEIIRHHVEFKKIPGLSNGLGLSDRDTYLIVDAYTLKSFALFDFLGSHLWHNRYKRFVNAWLEIPIDVAVAFWDEFDRLLFRLKEGDDLITTIEGDNARYDEFKHRLLLHTPGTGQLIGLMKEDIIEILKGNLSRAQELRSILLFESRITLKDVDDLDQAAVDKLLSVERKNATFKLPDMSRYNEIIREWTQWVHPLAKFKPRHGPGATAESIIAKKRGGDFRYLKSKLGKYECCNTHLVNQHLRQIPFCGTNGHDLSNVMRQTLGTLTKPQLMHCEAITVPKGIMSRRMIAAEPAGLGYLQQGYANSLDFQAIPWVDTRIDLVHGDLVNREYARKGSINPFSYGTIDLSSASDNIAWQLVRAFFKDTPWLRVLGQTRSIFTRLLDGELIENERYAPNGSALCFPVECLVFLCITKRAIQIHYDRTGKLFDSCGVYGDDIACHSKVAEITVTLLQELGMTPNPQKSFYTNEGFRESCGGEFYHGYDVTPVRLSRKFNGTTPLDFIDPQFYSNHWAPPLYGGFSTSQITSTIDLMNRCFALFPSVRSYLLERVISKLPFWLQPSFTSNQEDTSRVYTPSATNYQRTGRKLRREYKPGFPLFTIKHGELPRSPQQDYQITLIRCGRLATEGSFVDTKSPSFDYLKYFDIMVSKAEQPSPEEREWSQPHILSNTDVAWMTEPIFVAQYYTNCLQNFDDRWASQEWKLSDDSPRDIWTSQWEEHHCDEIVDVAMLPK